MSVSVRAAVLREMGLPPPYATSRPLEIAELGLDGPGPGELRVRVRAAGLCHSDLSVVDGSRPRPMPMVLGHEAAGEVLEVGDGAEDFRQGDQVVLAFVPACGGCGPCRVGRPALCEPGGASNLAGTLLSGAVRWDPSEGDRLHHHLGVSAFSEEIVVSARSAVRVDSEVAPEIAALFGCAVLTGVGAVVNTAGVRLGQSVAVFGLGGVGLAAVLGAVAAGAGPVVAVDRVPEKLALARSLGASVGVEASEEAAAAVRAATGGGADHAIETVGDESVLAEAYAATRRGRHDGHRRPGRPGADALDPGVSLVAEERTLRGSYLGSCVPERDIPRFVALYRAGRLPVDRLVTHRLRLEELNEGFDRLARGEAVRQVVVLD
jgi:alcohol dehydrogenase